MYCIYYNVSDIIIGNNYQYSHQLLYVHLATSSLDPLLISLSLYEMQRDARNIPQRFW